ncbi:hypothetical protein KL86PLE_40853 [uncultured Pleomorphomonas sp.]|uniref:Uncharacterized protein n=1 Tax=uncultured Pleomorphomonas sp. TaxID=442121 RepID=A0A212LHS1_9HYPH|nr:hypothetical protein KL86PLE_40853 [uncultured Pleomorphomonas sp.]
MAFRWKPCFPPRLPIGGSFSAALYRASRPGLPGRCRPRGPLAFGSDPMAARFPVRDFIQVVLFTTILLVCMF